VESFNFELAEVTAAAAIAAPDGMRVGLEFHLSDGQIVRVSLPAGFAAGKFWVRLVWALQRCELLQASTEGLKPN
jgi:hypothetical protein